MGFIHGFRLAKYSGIASSNMEYIRCMSLPQITGDLLNVALRLVREMGLPLLVAAILLLFLPPWIAAALFLTFPLLLAAIVVLASITVFAPPPWLVHITRDFGVWASSWWRHLTMKDRQKRLLGPFALIKFEAYWFRAGDEDLQRLLDHKLLFQEARAGEVLLVRLSTPHGQRFVEQHRKSLREHWQRRMTDAVGQEINRTMVWARERQKELSGRI
jgi:hypothetical protein